MNVTQPQTIQVKPKTKIEVIRVINLSPCLYKVLRSFVESSLKDNYPWRMGYQYGNIIEWQKPNKWRLTVFLDVTPVSEFKSLPVPGVYMLRSSQIPVFAELQPLQCSPSLDFVLLSNGDVAILAPISIPYKDKEGILSYGLALARTAPFAFTSTVPFARPILTYEIIDTLNEYVEIS